ncbi:hypothetical protein GCM10008171_32690 [Methylopila jiangsuensis]|uniref:Uncharacterized protein n=1 Tax=Methylopila jiangsuensis TaxID=586230 RepID=A0A9W6JI17_9HYPH|nr:hypothetical protein [Methylopila jiangsuensis]MDR6284596.1 hypothetical protein [Methylopila jiangsuensis]GLK78015.1 hypothetical protein GCM10008171_32690 [Methylopila jiangsuensis]
MALRDIERSPITMRRTPRGLEPVSALDAELIDRHPIGSDIEVSIRRRRSSAQNALYWSVLAAVIASGRCAFATAEHLHEALKEGLGYVVPRRLLDGSTAWRTDSTAFANMDAAEFRIFFDRAMEAISTQVLPGVDPIALLDEARAKIERAA